MTHRIEFILLAAAMASGSAHAALQGRDLNGSPDTFEAYYDTELGATWLADTWSAGLMDWATANAWAANLSFYNPITHQTYDNWRLPTVKPVNGESFIYSFSHVGTTDHGYNVSEQGTAFAGSTGSEMAHLFYNTLNNKGFCDPVLSTVEHCWGPQADWGLSNRGPFGGLQPDLYWSATEQAPETAYAWTFSFDVGYQSGATKGYDFRALAVHPGDVAAIPEPQTYALMLAGLALIGWRALSGHQVRARQATP
jgi:hypothetical protein